MEDFVSISIEERLKNTPPMSPEVRLFRVPKLLREVNQSAYEPKVVAIGPYHRGKDHLKTIEEHKIQYLQMLLHESERTVSELVDRVRGLEARARKCYAEPIGLSIDEFVEMMLLDGCFILQLIRMCSRKELRDPNDFVFKLDQFDSSICCDLLLVENQLPFFVLWELSCMLVEDSDENSFKEALIKAFNALPFIMPRTDLPTKPVEEIKHLLEFIHYCLLRDANIFEQGGRDWKFISCATTLQGFGVNFEAYSGTSLFSIRFEDGTLKIPRISIGDDRERFLRNLVAFEQLYPDDRLHLVTDFIIVMDFLIDSARDVEILCQHDIIKNLLGDNEAVATMFNKLFVHVYYDPIFHYSKLFNDINEYCNRVRNRRWNKCIAYLKRNYFNSPWAPLVSVSAASLLLLLTVLQTIFTILSYTK